jgi:hypothetical protein
MNTQAMDSTPWFRQRWPWLLIAGPAIVVVAGIVTIWLAIRSDDGLVADDYYKQGLAINQVIGRAERAQALGLTAKVTIGAEAAPPGTHKVELHVRAVEDAAVARAEHTTFILPKP